MFNVELNNRLNIILDVRDTIQTMGAPLADVLEAKVLNAIRLNDKIEQLR